MTREAVTVAEGETFVQQHFRIRRTEDTFDQQYYQTRKAEDGEVRRYGVSTIPVLDRDTPPDEREDLLLALYREVNTSWRNLVDVRFKLLGLVPTVSILLLGKLLETTEPGKGLPDAARITLAVVGLITTLCLLVYERRNSGLHDDLISRGRRIEAELGIAQGPFLGRREAPRKILQHDAAIWGIYGIAILAWLAAPFLVVAT
jgi:hypothetical protein